MDEAVVVFSRKGLFQWQIKAQDIRSREHARKLWPLVAPDAGHELVTWVSPIIENGKRRQRSHFRRLPAQHTFDLKVHFEQEESDRQSAVRESQEHWRAKELIAAELSRRISEGLALPWSFKDDDASDYALKGNLLLGADQIVTEHPLTTPFGSRFQLDVAVLGPPIQSESMTLGAVEIEFGHAFDGRKALMGKSLGFPLISIDIAGMTLEDITPKWAHTALTATTRSHEQGRRQTYIYLHDLLYPLYAQLPLFLDNEQRHQYLVFADDDTLHKLVQRLKLLAIALKYPKDAVDVAIVNGKSEQAYKVLEHAGSVVGTDWAQFNNHQCLRVTIPRPKGLADLHAHLFHMTMARLLLSHDALVGYKYCKGVDNNHPEEDVWVAHRWIPEHTIHRVLPKRLAEPINRLMSVVSDLQSGRPRRAYSPQASTPDVESQ